MTAGLWGWGLILLVACGVIALVAVKLTAPDAQTVSAKKRAELADKDSV